MFSRKCRTLTVLILLLVVIGVIMVGSSSRVWHPRNSMMHPIL